MINIYQTFNKREVQTNSVADGTGLDEFFFASHLLDNATYGTANAGVAPIPLLAGIPPLLAALGVLGLMQRRKAARA